jgi:quercetin dioxygenase-like cupin family protein
VKTIQISTEEMQKRIARYRELKPLPIQNPSIPEKARDVVYSRKLLSVIGLETKTNTPINAGAPIVGAAGMTMTLAVCPPGQGPGLHSHRNTYETFTVMKGRFEVRWNDDGSGAAVLELYETISLPPGVCRSFRNIGTGEGILQVIITGGVHDMSDIDFSEKAKQEIEAVRPGLAAEFEKAGFTLPPGAEARERFADRGGAARPHKARGFLAVIQEHERRPELHAERAPERLAARVGDLQVPHAGMRGEGFSDERLGAAAVAAPGTAELEERRAFKRVDLGALRLGFGIGGIHRRGRPKRLQNSGSPFQSPARTTRAFWMSSVRSQRAATLSGAAPNTTPPAPPPERCACGTRSSVSQVNESLALLVGGPHAATTCS